MANGIANNNMNNGQAPQLRYELRVQIEVKNKVDENNFDEVVYTYNNLSDNILPYKTISVAEVAAAQKKPFDIVGRIRFNDVIHAIRRDELLSPNFVTIKDPLTIDFNVFRYPYSENACEADIRVFNLSEKTRFKIQKLRQMSEPFRLVELRAGKVDSATLPIIAKGYLLRAYSEKDRVDVVTSFHIMGNVDMAANAYAAKQKYLPVKNKDSVTKPFFEQVFKGVADNKIGFGKKWVEAIEAYNRSPDRQVTILNNTVNVINENVSSSNRLIVDNLEPFMYNDGDFREGGFDGVINVDSGLMGAPIIEENKIMISMMFEPRFIMLQRVKLQSFTYPSYFDSGIFKIIGIEHTGMISGAMNGPVITKLTLLVDSGTFESITGIDLRKFEIWDAKVTKENRLL